MVWSKRKRRRENPDLHRQFSRNLDAALGKSARGMPVADRQGMGAGSRGGAPIWVMREAYMPSPCTCEAEGRRHCRRHAAMDFGAEEQADPDGFAVFGRFPKGWLNHVLHHRLLGDVRRDEILHVCSGALQERWRVDIRPEARPVLVADGRHLPFRSDSFPAVLLDPPYSEEYARNLYGTGNPRPSHLLREAVRVVIPGGRVGILHVAVPFLPPGCHLVAVYGVTTGAGFRIRAFTVFQKQQDGLPFTAEAE